MTYRLAVDLGTTFTAAAVANGSGPAMVGLGNRALQIPSVLYLTSGGCVVGEAAERRGAVDPSRLAREFKRRIGDPVPLLIGGVPYSAEALGARLLRWVVEQTSQRMGEPPSAIVVTHPANWGPYKLEMLSQLVALADVGPAVWCPEPVAAAVQYAVRSAARPGARIAVYDLGGGTFDVCILEKTADDFVIRGVPEGVEHLGGVDFDEALFRHVLASLGGDSDLLQADTPELAMALARLRRDCVEAKEALSTDVEVTVPVSLPGHSSMVRLTRGGFEDLIRPALEETLAALARTLRTAGGGAVDAIVLVGGSSRIPLVSELVTRRFGVPAALDTHPKHDIALGAVQWAMESATRRAEPVEAPAVALRQAQGAGEGVDLRQAQGTGEGVDLRQAQGTGDEEQGGTVEAPRAHRRRTVLVAAAAAGVLTAVVVGFVVDAGTGTRAEPAASAAAAHTPSAATSSDVRGTPRSPARAALPWSAPLLDSQLVVPMRVDGNWDLYLADTTRPGPVSRLTEDAAIEYGPTLSPDRRTVVYMRGDDPDGDDRTLWVAGAADGSHPRPLFRKTPSVCAATMYRPAWSETDQSLLAVPCANRQGQVGLYLFRTDGTLVREVDVPGPAVDDPAFSHDGRQLVYWSGPDASVDGGALYVESVDGSGSRRQLTVPVLPGEDGDPVWSPDDKTIVFRRRVGDGTPGGNEDLYAVSADRSTKPRVLLHGAGNDQDPTFSPDGKLIAYQSTAATKSWPGAAKRRAWVVNADGTDPHVLWTRDAPDQQVSPAWSAR